jgi:hypothetical protein
VIANIGGLSFPNAVGNVDADITSILLLPNPVENNAVVRINVRRTMKIDWSIVDAQGRVVMSFSRQVLSGTNDLQVQFGKLAAGTYQLVGSTGKGRVPQVRIIKL